MNCNNKNGGIKAVIIDEKDYRYDEYGGVTIIDYSNMSEYYRINDCIYKSRSDYEMTNRDQKLKDLGL